MKYEIEGHIIETANPLSTDEIDDIATSLGSKNYDTTLAGRDSRISALTQPMVEGAKAGLSAALPSEDFNKPIAPTSGNPVMGALQAAGQTLRDPTRISSTVSAPGQVTGDKVTDALGGGTLAKGAGLATSVALDPQSYIGMGEGARQGIKQSATKFSDIINDGLAKISKWKYGANVPEKAAEIAQKAKFNLPAGSADEIENAVGRVQDVLTKTKDNAGAILNDAKAKIGIPTTIKEKEASLLAGNGTHGLGKHELNSETQKMLDSKTPEELASNIAYFKRLSEGGNSDPKLTARVANALQDKVNQFVDWQKSGSDIEGVLKQQYKALGDIVTDNAVGLQSAKGDMAKTLDVFNDLKNRLADPDKSGKAEQFLRNLFTSKSAASKDYLESLAKLEHISGKPVLSDLFKQFAGEAFSKASGNSKGTAMALGEAGTALAFGHPGAALAGLGAMGVQSPAMIKLAGQANQAVSTAAQKAIESKLAKIGLTTGLVSLKNDRTLQSFKDKLKK